MHNFVIFHPPIFYNPHPPHPSPLTLLRKIFMKFLAYPIIKTIKFIWHPRVISTRIASGEKIYKEFNGYMNDGCKIKLSYIMLPKTGSHVKTQWMHFLIGHGELLKIIIIFRIKSTTVYKKHLIVNLFAIKNF